MGLNLETLIGILVILILLILVDGMRRMIRERHGRLRMRIDPRYRDQPEEEEDRGHNPELIGSARVIRRAMEEDQKERPPMVMEPDEAAADTRTAEQQSLFEAEQGSAPQPGGAPEPQPEVAPAPNPSAVERQPESTPEPREAPRQEPRIEPKAAPKTPREPQPVLEVIVVHLIAHRGAPFDGGALLRMLLEAGLRYGRMNIFHRHVSVNGADDLQFSMANAVEPGTFDLDTMESKTFAGVTFFLKLPGPTDARSALDKMLSICQRLASELDGELKDEQHSVLTPQTMEHLRQRVQEFERRQRVPSV
ncbi:MAG: cell division protein ZipA [Alcanivorax borkumensis]|jgi:cell division protein ZipA|uniref:Cell division protein ZipA n=1 Tax=Alcanivorax borkumensis (strain ATCC 700651 / DSM 11573 / NCIMB 13689 / SK2) TaxID=393595 RepID=Q0VR02_ALCBS|nr:MULTISPECIES: cell division protein ZipA [Alcanivorax]EUC71612.1 cell division protein ZipA [Alcanivorax sp. 97CO-5]OJH06677.1 MAG: cell division protein ZipA [Alcanivorax borkumensis]PKG03030.1 cell division protein ZipA [Alcanivorax sp. 97CO-6]CAL16396.1 cell division protein ZipA [Alcanivorax borkumensis SK2]